MGVSPPLSRTESNMKKKIVSEELKKATAELLFVTGIETLYEEMYPCCGSGMFLPDRGLQYAHSLYEEKYPDKFTEARKIQQDIDSLNYKLNNLLQPEEDDCDDDY